MAFKDAAWTYSSLRNARQVAAFQKGALVFKFLVPAITVVCVGYMLTEIADAHVPEDYTAPVARPFAASAHSEARRGMTSETRAAMCGAAAKMLEGEATCASVNLHNNTPVATVILETKSGGVYTVTLVGAGPSWVGGRIERFI